MNKHIKWSVVLLCILSFALGGISARNYQKKEKKYDNNQLIEDCFWYGVHSAVDIIRVCGDDEDTSMEDVELCVKGGAYAKLYELKEIQNGRNGNTVFSRR